MTVERPNAFLCIGGPWDGKRVARHDGAPYFKTMKRDRWPPPIFSAAAENVLPVTIETIVYVADHIRSKDKQVWFWRPEGQGLAETLELLMTRYEQANNINWQDDYYRS